VALERHTPGHPTGVSAAAGETAEISWRKSSVRSSDGDPGKLFLQVRDDYWSALTLGGKTRISGRADRGERAEEIIANIVFRRRARRRRLRRKAKARTRRAPRRATTFFAWLVSNSSRRQRSRAVTQDDHNNRPHANLPRLLPQRQAPAASTVPELARRWLGNK
jgi:hypothetical protein